MSSYDNLPRYGSTGGGQAPIISPGNTGPEPKAEDRIDTTKYGWRHEPLEHPGSLRECMNCRVAAALNNER